ncbi:hypothetical protein THC_1791 [Caldimicrobium thiodismutans]|uniref:DUF8196 domain-containing protein n=1 Tax=Caldimicrobium thiodismutans TaxID=1653476 RepID=A0A0U4N4D8_9BACT|nr:hypothetical protein [Caldimicrobium thiodismutans]BAU24150.1 hypothetical protein THC_1791 [Caldimicrobium thiodismutans]
MSLLAVDLIKALEELEPPVRKIFIKILEKLEKSIGDTVKREDFLELKNIVSDLTKAQKETQEEIKKLAEAQKKTEEELKKLAEEHKKTEEELRKLVEEHRKTREDLHQLRKDFGGFTRSLSYAFENEAYRNLPKVLKEKYGIEVTERFIRTEIEGEEINFLAKGRVNGKEVVLVGEAKLRFDEGKRDFDRALKEIEKKEIAVRKVYRDKEVVKLIVTHYAKPRALKMAEEKGIIVVQSFEW